MVSQIEQRVSSQDRGIKKYIDEVSFPRVYLLDNISGHLTCMRSQVCSCRSRLAELITVPSNVVADVRSY